MSHEGHAGSRRTQVNPPYAECNVPSQDLFDKNQELHITMAQLRPEENLCRSAARRVWVPDPFTTAAEMLANDSEARKGR
jgi:hypothetical protein